MPQLSNRLRVSLMTGLGLLAALMPLLVYPAETNPQTDFPGWPLSFEGKKLKPLPLTEAEAGFVKGFPGRVGKFALGNEVMILRWINHETRLLHPAVDCYRGIGYTITPQTVSQDTEGNRNWGRSLVSKDGQNLLVQEQILDPAQQSWSDVSAWYWAALLKQTKGPWWAITRVKQIDK